MLRISTPEPSPSVMATGIVSVAAALQGFAGLADALLGAVAISSLAATELLLGARALDTLSALKPALPDLDLAMWSFASALMALQRFPVELRLPTWHVRGC